MNKLKFTILLIATVFLSNAKAQGQMPRCFTDAITMAQDRASAQSGERWEYVNANVRFENNLQIDWEIDLEKLINSETKSLRVDLTKSDCKIIKPCCSPCNPNCINYPSCPIQPGSCH